ncbi:hypothetical protein TREMEDRAFT_33585 [Tremella mesenterica DSM 1558]|uniref:uncharacterized protein n=1 Tax=Tremella mesenterica (strain ATCC 24925 / CBS 8224 / DSM 1558 / NBRC 9311 / NRRL Y-6157 / RJB 2259-6 / UBC 559-6) TaxID=578456 RepID=UPI0003F49C9D|nr:uncharacterized protein TREMEDRAFT_33585 [Tremella mesenterica DSM 1558]EIW67501.1 hypothetical protein TREMEDRAFT_33585 [Tremella mesenterica DSM 1558]
MSPQPQDFGHYKLLETHHVNYAPLVVSKWRSQRTGLTVVVGQHKAPITNGHFVIASEIFDDSGRPHTLEHLVFLGSKDYPYKGVLDQLANRAGSNGTNAWTANDHTAYTIATAGTQGFLKMLPIYVDHIFHPTMTDAGFVTEIHHINEAGEDAGVVYSEMQARENTSGDLMALESQRLLYPQSSAYRSETGGLMSQLRILTPQQIRDYHASYYVPHNSCLLIDGAVPLAELFHVLNEEVDPLILKNLATSSRKWHLPTDWKRPFIESTTSQPLSIPSPKTQVVEFMEEDESMGEIVLLWLGPSPMDYLSGLALKILGSYLTLTATAPLQKEFIEISKPYASYIGVSSEDRVNKNEISMYISDVPTKHLEELPKLILEKLRKIAEEEGVDEERMKLVLRQDKRKLLDHMETSVSGVLSDVVIGDFLYGDLEGKDLPSAFDDLKDYAILEKWSGSDWQSFLKKQVNLLPAHQYFISQNCLTIIGKPSAALAQKIESDEKERIAKRKEEFGKEKLEELGRMLKKAKEESDTPPPEEMITSFPLTDPKSLTWIPVETAINNALGESKSGDRGELQKRIESDGNVLPYEVHFANVDSNFVHVSVLFDTIHLKAELRPYMSIFQNALFRLGVKKPDGSELSYEQVVDQLNDLTVSHSASFSFRNSFSEVFLISLKVEKPRYEEAVEWIRDLITGGIFTKERISIILAKMAQELPYNKRQGDSVSLATLNSILYDPLKSTSEACGLLKALEFVPETMELLEGSPEVVLSHLEEIRAYLLDPAIIRVSVRGDVKSLQHPRKVLQEKFFRIEDPKPLRPISTSADTLSVLGKNPKAKCIIIPMSSIEGSYSNHSALGPKGFSHPDLPALLLSAAVLNATESYLWRSIRGNGLAYGAHVDVDAESGLVGFSVYRSPNALEAYRAAGKLLQGLADGSVELEQSILDGARATMTFSYARESETVSAAAASAYLNEALKGLGKDHHQHVLTVLPSITLSQIRQTIKTHFLPIFSSQTSVCAITVNSGKAEEVEGIAKEMGFEVERKELPVLGDEGSEDGSEFEGEESEGSSS